MGVLDASTSPPKERYAVSNDNVIHLIQPENSGLTPQKKSRHRVVELPIFGKRLASVRCWAAFDRRPIMAMFDFAVLAVKVLFFIWGVQLVWIGSRLLERPAKRLLRSVLMSEGTPMTKAAQALRSSF